MEVAIVWWMFGCVFFVAPLNWWGKKYRILPETGLAMVGLLLLPGTRVLGWNGPGSWLFWCHWKRKEVKKIHGGLSFIDTY
ncbi:unnamed protein product [Durusdinium trenchii]|uniref:Uncharacterized protein n=1 Tax=Durusdinium trenchii TaxID=1381693 RepID=A0ABP0KRS2_9DINO